MGAVGNAFLDVIAHGSGLFVRKKQEGAARRARAVNRQIENEKRRARADEAAKLGAATQGRSIKGQAGDGSLLTGAGGTSDPALTGKNTLLGSQ